MRGKSRYARRYRVVATARCRVLVAGWNARWVIPSEVGLTLWQRTASHCWSFRPCFVAVGSYCLVSTQSSSARWRTILAAQGVRHECGAPGFRVGVGWFLVCRGRLGDLSLLIGRGLTSVRVRVESYTRRPPSAQVAEPHLLEFAFKACGVLLRWTWPIQDSTVRSRAMTSRR